MHPTKPLRMDDLMRIEENEGLLEYRFSFNDFLMWPSVRFFLFQSAIQESNALPARARSKKSVRGMLNYAFQSFLYRPTTIEKRNQIVFFGAATSDVRVDGKYFNRLTECFAQLYREDTTIIESSDNQTFYRPRTFSPVYYHDWLIIYPTILSNLHKTKEIDKERIERFIDYLQGNFPYRFENKDIWNNAKTILTKFSKRLPSLYKMYNGLFTKIRPRVIFLEDAHYGGTHSILIRCAKDLNIPVHEYQHGIVSLTHPAYNYGIALYCTEYKKYLPSSFLAYGNYWKKNIRTPSEVVVIGNPYLTETIKNYSKSSSTDTKSQILFTTSEVDPERSAVFLKELIHKIDRTKYNVVLRPHPSERSKIEELYGEVLALDVSVDTGDLYRTLATTDFLIGEISTVLFEATAFNIPVFTFDNEITRMNADISYFNLIREPCDFIDCLINSNYKVSKENEFWDPDWVRNYRNFIEHIPQ